MINIVCHEYHWNQWNDWPIMVGYFGRYCNGFSSMRDTFAVYKCTSGDDGFAMAVYTYYCGVPARFSYLLGIPFWRPYTVNNLYIPILPTSARGCVFQLRDVYPHRGMNINMLFYRSYVCSNDLNLLTIFTYRMFFL